ncbi:hypothetical protein D3C72_689820 [compost metagenome]
MVRYDAYNAPRCSSLGEVGLEVAIADCPHHSHFNRKKRGVLRVPVLTRYLIRAQQFFTSSPTRIFSMRRCVR